VRVAIYCDLEGEADLSAAFYYAWFVPRHDIMEAKLSFFKSGLFLYKSRFAYPLLWISVALHGKF